MTDERLNDIALSVEMNPRVRLNGEPHNEFRGKAAVYDRHRRELLAEVQRLRSEANQRPAPMAEGSFAHCGHGCYCYCHQCCPM